MSIFAPLFGLVKRKTLLVFLLGLMGFSLQAQQVFLTLKGRVTDARSGDPLPFVNVVLDGRFIGTSTDTAGNYTLKVPKNAMSKSDTLMAASLGYRTLKKKINPEQSSQTIDFVLQVSDIQLNEIVVNGEDPSVILFRKIQQFKHKNNPENAQSLRFESYVKYELDLDGVSKKSLQNDKIMKNFPFLQHYLDTVTEKGKSVLPFFLVENLSDVYKQKDPTKYTERMKGVKISGIQKQDFITELLSNVNQNFNIYDNTISALGKSFISPVADYGLNTYRYFLFYNDTLTIDGEPHLEMEFKPKRKGENTLKGKMIVNLKTYAIQSIEAEISEGQATGILEGMSFFQDFKCYRIPKGDSVETYWLPNKEYLDLKLNYYLSKDAKIIGRKSKSYRNLIIDQAIDPALFTTADATDIDEKAYEQTDEFWNQNRHELLLDKEKGIYSMVDSIKRTTAFKLVSYAGRAMATGFLPAGPVSFGPFANVFSLNQIEKVRFKLGIQTTDKLSERFRLMLYGVYGVADNRFKYGGKFEFIFTRKPWNKITLLARTDIDFMSRHSSEMDHDNVFTLIQKRTPQRLYNIEEFKMVFDHEFHRDLTAYLTIQHQRYSPYFDFKYLQEGQIQSRLNTSEVGIMFKYQHNASALSGKYNKEAKANKLFAMFRKKNPWPVMYLRYFSGIGGILESQFTYHDVSLGLESDFPVTAKQSFYYNIWGGQIFGTLPFLLLRNPEGNYNHVFNKYLFQNMSLLEFSADRYISGNFQYSFGGALFDKIPLWNKLKLTEVLTCSVFYGNTSTQNKEFNKLNKMGTAYPVPYVEAGAGIANILKFIRLDGVWRITHLNKKGDVFFCVYASLYIKI
jgi:hypothetical protein